MCAWRSFLLAISGLMGAGGVAMAAAGAHMGGESLTSAATFLLVHAAVVAGLAASGAAIKGLNASASLLAFGALLFSGDIAARALLAAKLFPMAAPIGGMVMILAWLSLILVALVARRSVRSVPSP